MGVHIELTNPSKSYYTPGEFVKGLVRLRNINPDNVKEALIHLVGRAKVHWKAWETNAGCGAGRGMDLRRRQYSINKAFVCKHTSHDVENLQIAPEGAILFPFNFRLPQNLPSSFISASGSVSYFITAEIKKFSYSFKSSVVVQVPFEIVAEVDLNFRAEASLSRQECSISKGPNFFAGRKGEISFVFGLSKSGFVIGEDIHFLAEISNGSNRKITKKSVSLQHMARFSVEGRFKTEKQTVRCVQGPALGKLRWENWEGCLRVPKVPPTDLGGKCGFIKLKYFLHFEMKISGLSSSLSGMLPVVIGTIPFRHREELVEQSHIATCEGIELSLPNSPGQTLPSLSLEPRPSTSREGAAWEKSSNVPNNVDVPFPSAPTPSISDLTSYTDQNPPSYAEAVVGEALAQDSGLEDRSKNDGASLVDGNVTVGNKGLGGLELEQGTGFL